LEVFTVRLRAEIDANQAESRRHITNFPTDENQFEVYCDMCGEVYFVDEIIFDQVAKALREGFENPFVCDDCRGELDELAYL
jgi:hypothetical protein